MRLQGAWSAFWENEWCQLPWALSNRLSATYHLNPAAVVEVKDLFRHPGTYTFDLINMTVSDERNVAFPLKISREAKNEMIDDFVPDFATLEAEGARKVKLDAFSIVCLPRPETMPRKVLGSMNSNRRISYSGSLYRWVRDRLGCDSNPRGAAPRVQLKSVTFVNNPSLVQQFMDGVKKLGAPHDWPSCAAASKLDSLCREFPFLGPYKSRIALMMHVTDDYKERVILSHGFSMELNAEDTQVIGKGVVFTSNPECAKAAGTKQKIIFSWVAIGEPYFVQERVLLRQPRCTTHFALTHNGVSIYRQGETPILVSFEPQLCCPFAVAELDIIDPNATPTGPSVEVCAKGDRAETESVNFNDMQAERRHASTCSTNAYRRGFEGIVDSLVDCESLPSDEPISPNDSSCGTEVVNCSDPAAIQHIQQTFGLNRVLNLVLNHPIDEHLDQLRNAPRQIQALAFVNAGACTPVALRDALAAASSVRCVAITGNCSLNDLTILDALADHHLLQSLNVAGCEKLSDASLIEIAAKCPLLQSLNVAGCKQLTNASLMEFAAKCPQLQSLNVAGCEKLSDASLIEIAAKCPLLQSLNVAGCKQLTNASLMEVAAKCPQLQSLNAAGCKQTATARLGDRPKEPSSQLKQSMNSRALELHCVSTGSTDILTTQILQIGQCTKNVPPPQPINDQSVLIAFNTIRLTKRITTGSCGPVYAGTLATNEAVAIKELTGAEAVDACMRVCGRHMMLHHPNVVRVRGMSEDGRGHAFVITELAPDGSLVDALNSHPQRNDWATLVNWALDIAYGLRYLHSLTPPLLHLNLKPQNVLLFEDDTAKLCDFDTTNIMEQTVNYQSVVQRSAHYVAPELFEGMPGTEATDVYGFGGVLFAMITNSEPWVGLSVHQICGKLAAGTPPSLPPRCPDKLAAIVRRCLQIDPRQRCPLSQVIEDLIRVRGEQATPHSPGATTPLLERQSLPPESGSVAFPNSLREILNQFERCPAPPGRTDIPARFQNPTLDAIRAEYDRVAFFIPQSYFLSIRDHEDAMAVGLYTDESFVYWLTSAWANDTSADKARGLRHVGPFMQRLTEALPRCCPRYIGPAVRVLRAGAHASQAMQNAFADYERQFAEGTLLRCCAFASLVRGSAAHLAFVCDSSIAFFCSAVEAFDVYQYSMVRLTRGHCEREVLCPRPLAFRVSQPPTKTQFVVSVYTEMQAAPVCTGADGNINLSRERRRLPLLQVAHATVEDTSKDFPTGRDTVLAAVKKDSRALQYISNELRSDREFMLAAVKENGLAIQYASSELRSDLEVVFAAVKQCGFALDYAADELRCNHEVVLAAVKQNGMALEYASNELRSNREIVLAAAEQNGWALEYASHELHSDELVAAARWANDAESATVWAQLVDAIVLKDNMDATKDPFATPEFVSAFCQLAGSATTDESVTSLATAILHIYEKTSGTTRDALATSEIVSAFCQLARNATTPKSVRCFTGAIRAITLGTSQATKDAFATPAMASAFSQMAVHATTPESVQWLTSAICAITDGSTQTTKDAFATPAIVFAFCQLSRNATTPESVQWLTSAICAITDGSTQNTKDAFATPAIVFAFCQLSRNATTPESVQWLTSAICAITDGSTQTTKDAFATPAIVASLNSLSQFAFSEKSRETLIGALDVVSPPRTSVPDVSCVLYPGVISFPHDYRPPCGAQEAIERCGLEGVTNLTLIAREAAAIADRRLAHLPTAAGGPCRLDRDLAIAIAAYTYDLDTESADPAGAGNFCCRLNVALRQRVQDRNSETLKKLKPYLYYLFRGLEALPAATNRVVYRGVPSCVADVRVNYRREMDVYWTSFASASEDCDTAIKLALKEGSSGVIFHITSLTSRYVKWYSATPHEGEVIFSPNSSFTVSQGPHEEVLNGVRVCVVNLVERRQTSVVY